MFGSNYLKNPTGIPLVSYNTNFDFDNVVYNGRKSKSNEIGITLLQPHYHSEMELLYIIDGNVTIEINNNMINAKKGDVIIVNPFEMHSLRAECNQNKVEYTYLDFDLGLIYNQYGITDFTKKLFGGSMKFENHISSQTIGKAIREIDRIYQLQQKAWEVNAIAMLYSIFYELLKDDLLICVYGENNDDFSIALCRYIERNYWKNITSKDAATELSYNHSYFCRLFKKNFQKSFSNYLNEIRIEKACRLIHGKKDKIQELALLTGFENTAHFSKVFKSFKGITPTEYIKNIKE